MSYSLNPVKRNTKGLFFLWGDEKTIGSKRISIDLDTNNPCVEKLIAEDIWQADSFEFGPDTVWIGKAAGLAAAGHHILTENIEGEFHLLPHSDFDGEISQSDTKTLFSFLSLNNQVGQPDDSNEWTGKSIGWIGASTVHGFVRKGYFKTGSVAATKPIRLRTYEGTDENGKLVFDQSYPPEQFPANTTVEIIENGFTELTPGLDLYMEMLSEEDFSILTDAAGINPWAGYDVSLLRYDNLLQTTEWIDGTVFSKDQWFIKNRKIYVCNVAGAQTGTFEDNSDKWDVLGKIYTETDPVFSASPSAGIVSQDIGNWNEAFSWGDHSQAGYLNSYTETDPVFTAWDKSSGISITESQITDLKPYLLSESDPIFTAWDKSTGISITESQISDLNHFNGVAGNLSGITQNRVAFGNASGGLIDSSNFMYSDSALRINNGGIYLDRSDADSYLVFKRSGSQVGQIRGADGSIDITASGGSSVHLSVDMASGITSMSGVNTSKIGNSDGILKLNPDATGIVELFGDADVDNSENGRMLYVWRRAPEGDDYLRFYISDNRVGVVSAPLDLTVYGGESVTLQSGAENVIFRVGDDAGVFGTYFKNSSNAIIGSVDSLGNAQFNVSIDVPEISNTLGLLKIQPDVQGDVEVFGDTDVGNDENSKILKIWRRAPEGNDYIRFYISQTRNAYIHASNDLTLQGQVDFTINSVTGEINYKVGDNAGVKKVN